MGVSNALVDLGMLPVQDIPQLLKSARGVLMALVSFYSTCEKRRPQALVHGTELVLAAMPMASGCLPIVFPTLLSFAPRSGCNIHFHLYIYKDIGKLVSLHLSPRVPNQNHHDCVFPE
jgi:hypothetical protein